VVVDRIFRHRGGLLVVLGVLVIAVPTAFAEFPEATSWSLWVRSPIAVAWLFAAGLAVLIATSQDDRLRRHLDETQKHVVARHNRVTVAILAALLNECVTGVPASFTWTVATWDDESNRLQPVFPDRDLQVTDPRVFSAGTGASGTAFARNGVVTAMTDAVSNEDFDLTDEQKAYFAKYQAVAAVPLTDSLGRPFGALSAISEDADEYFESTDASEQLRDLAEAVSTVLLNISTDQG
jgi:hypothetical protein